MHTNIQSDLSCIPAQAYSKHFTIILLIFVHVDLGSLCEFLCVAVLIHVLHGDGCLAGHAGCSSSPQSAAGVAELCIELEFKL